MRHPLPPHSCDGYVSSILKLFISVNKVIRSCGSRGLLLIILFGIAVHDELVAVAMLLIVALVSTEQVVGGGKSVST